MKDKTTDDLRQALMAESNIDSYLRENQPFFAGQSIAELLAVYYERTDLSKAALARKAGMSEVYLHQVFAGRRNPSRDRLLCLCVGLETSLALTLMAFYQTGRLTLSEIIRKMSTRPAEIFHLPAGSLKIGAKADAVLFDPEEEYLFTESMLGSKSKNSPFLGKRLQGKVKYTILGGRIVYQDQ